MPTVEQALRCFQLCQNLTDMYLPIDMLRLDMRTGSCVIIAGNEVLIEVYPNGNWRFIYEL
ncbi:hypothetical protein FRE64_06450 [Euhalothece natronophila Z-M001]|uniref:DUF6888 domain-containing protein n=1 Tax=Euhalothece natronophila Z-M001 TaxID=522448 RepID=A0A5B8NJW2_9CHRO|nr:hypothetical protein [Euhalothece natronophila]QDZ39603.1 hypothetical protein FRE64_06450 [Euhalothece natronophila Z-M001]